MEFKPFLGFFLPFCLFSSFKAHVFDMLIGLENSNTTYPISELLAPKVSAMNFL